MEKILKMRKGRRREACCCENCHAVVVWAESAVQVEVNFLCNRSSVLGLHLLREFPYFPLGIDLAVCFQDTKRPKVNVLELNWDLTHSCSTKESNVTRLERAK